MLILPHSSPLRSLQSLCRRRWASAFRSRPARAASCSLPKTRSRVGSRHGWVGGAIPPLTLHSSASPQSRHRRTPRTWATRCRMRPISRPASRRCLRRCVGWRCLCCGLRCFLSSLPFVFPHPKICIIQPLAPPRSTSRLCLDGRAARLVLVGSCPCVTKPQILIPPPANLPTKQSYDVTSNLTPFESRLKSLESSERVGSGERGQAGEGREKF